ncbi:isochorismatase family protein [uncultured Shewanella sp.]|uniref:isochorismatase family protein n=1 Tax=uncultured Shewanella sp. TaxID=173975 RepID=UPI0026237D35|nr:isochorismatase family protein [uncultured Shewanella sp.]
MSIKSLAAYTLPSSVDIPKNKVSWQFDPSRAALLIHDMQEYFVDFYGENNDLIKQVISHIAALKAFCKAQGIPVYYTAQPQEQSDEDRALLNDMWGKGLPQHPEKKPIISELTPDEDDIVFTKWRYSAFYRSSLKEQMTSQAKDQLIICGIYAHIGVMQTAVDAFMHDIKPFLVADAIADFTLKDHLTALNYIANNAGRVVCVDDIVTLDAKNQANKLSKSEMRAQILPLIEDADELDDDDNLMDFGLDSVAVMTLLSLWQKQGLNVTFVELAKAPTINGFWHTVSQANAL